jgi:prepilin-type N-terminal cleavage/methylation domain-containing protein
LSEIKLTLQKYSNGVSKGIMKNENGFTLVEAIVALFIGSMMLVAIYTAVNMGQRSSSGIERRVSAQQDARGALELMAMEIRMASYNPNSVGNIWVLPASCYGTSLNQAYRGIQEATANSIIIEMDVNDNGIINHDSDTNPNETIKYVYDTTNKYITRSTNCGDPQPFLGANTDHSDTKTVLVENDAAEIPLFRYYHGSGAQITAPVTAEIPNIRRIEITLVVDTFSSDPVSGTRKRIIYSTSVIPRNHIPSPTY